MHKSLILIALLTTLPAVPAKSQLLVDATLGTGDLLEFEVPQSIDFTINTDFTGTTLTLVLLDAYTTAPSFYFDSLDGGSFFHVESGTTFDESPDVASGSTSGDIADTDMAIFIQGPETTFEVGDTVRFNFGSFATSSTFTHDVPDNLSNAFLAVADSFSFASGATPNAVPEPATGALLGLAGLGVLLRRRR